ncbi:MAG: GTP-binding protein, partial [Candidatus Tectimicrobiota bacterium]
DAVNGAAHLSQHPEALKQVTSADDLVLTKTDLAPAETVTALLAHLQQLNPTARVHRAVHGSLPPETRHALLALQSTLTEESPRPSSPAPLPLPLVPLAAAAAHASDIQALALSFEQPLDWIAFSVWLSMLLHAHGERVLRVKGLLNVGASGPVVLNGVQHILHAPEHLAQWPGPDQRSHLVVIMRGLAASEVLRSLHAFQHVLGAAPSAALAGPVA